MNDFNFYLSMSLILLLVFINLGYTYYKHKDYEHKITWLRFHQDVMAFELVYCKEFAKYKESELCGQLTLRTFLETNGVGLPIEDYDFDIVPVTHNEARMEIKYGEFTHTLMIPLWGFRDCYRKSVQFKDGE